MAIKIPEERDVYPYTAWNPEEVIDGVEVCKSDSMFRRCVDPARSGEGQVFVFTESIRPR